MLIILYWGKYIFLIKKIDDKKKFWLSLLIVIIGVGIYLGIVVATLKYCRIVEEQNNIQYIDNIMGITNQIKSTVNQFVYNLYGKGIVPKYIYLFIMIAIAACALGIFDDIEQGSIFWVQFLGFIVLHSFFWFMLMTRVCTVIYSLMFWIWNSKQKKLNNNVNEISKKYKLYICPYIALTIFVFISTFSTFKIMYKDIKGNYSTGKIMASYIDKNIKKGTNILCLNDELQQSVIAYLKKDEYSFIHSNSNKKMTYITWDDNWLKERSEEEIKEKINELKTENNKVYVLTSSEDYRPILNQYNYSLLYKTDDLLVNSYYNRKEIYQLYEIVI